MPRVVESTKRPYTITVRCCRHCRAMELPCEAAQTPFPTLHDTGTAIPLHMTFGFTCPLGKWGCLSDCLSESGKRSRFVYRIQVTSDPDDECNGDLSPIECNSSAATCTSAMPRESDSTSAGLTTLRDKELQHRSRHQPRVPPGLP